MIQHHRTLNKERASSFKSLSRSMPEPQATDAVIDKGADDAEAGSSKGPISDLTSENQIMAESPVEVKDDILVKGLPEDTAPDMASEAALRDIDKLLVKRVLQLAVELETQARMLLLNALPKGSPAEVLLRADLVRYMTFLPLAMSLAVDLALFTIQRIQNREVKKLDLEDSVTKMKSEGLIDLTEPENRDIDTDERVRRYRKLFAALLAT